MRGDSMTTMRRLRRVLIDSIGSLRQRDRHSWIGRCHWLVRTKSWLAPMQVVAWMAALIALTALVGGIGGAILSIVGGTIGLCVSVVASAIAGLESIRNVVRFGGGGVLRPRWWFELARLLWICCLITALAFLAVVLVMMKFGVSCEAVWQFLLVSTSGLFAGFLVAATAGFVLAFARRRARLGRANQCVRYFYTPIVGVSLLGFATALWPPAAFLPEAVAVATFGAVGIALLMAWMLSLLRVRDSANLARGCSGVDFR